MNCHFLLQMIFPPRDQTCILHWQADSLPLSHQESATSPGYPSHNLRHTGKWRAPSDQCSSHLPSSPRTSKSSAQTFHRVSTTITTPNRNLSVSLVKNFRAARTWHLEQVAGVLPDAINLVTVAVLDTAGPRLLSAQNHQPEQLQQEPNFTQGPLEVRVPILEPGNAGRWEGWGAHPGTHRL